MGSVAGELAQPEGMPDALLLTLIAVIGVGIAATLMLSRPVAPSATPVSPDVGIGTVQTITDVVTIEVESVTGLRFTGRLRDDAVAAALRPGAVLLVAFDPAAREDLSLPDDIMAVRAAFDQMLVDKGLLTGHQLDVMVSRPDGGQFAVHETALIPASSLAKVSPGSVIDAYYRPGDESAIAVSVPPS